MRRVCLWDSRCVFLSFSSPVKPAVTSLFPVLLSLRSTVRAVPPQSRQPFHASTRGLPPHLRMLCTRLAHFFHGVHLLCCLIQPLYRATRMTAMSATNSSTVITAALLLSAVSKPASTSPFKVSQSPPQHHSGSATPGTAAFSRVNTRAAPTPSNAVHPTRTLLP